MTPPRNQIPWKHAATFVKRMKARGWFGRSKEAKYKAVRCEVDGIKFPSKREAAFYRKLLLLRKAMDSRDRVALIERQVPFALEVEPRGGGETRTCGKYLLDFRVTFADGTVKHFETKGFRTRDYRLKRKWVEARHGIEIVEV